MSVPRGFIERHVEPYVADSALWPVFLVLVGHFALALALAVLAVWREGSTWAAISVAAVAGLTAVRFGIDASQRRFGPLSVLLAATWVLTAVVAFIGHRNGIL